MTDLLEPWMAVDAQRRQLLEAELARELPPDHLLANKPLRAVAVRIDRDDVLFEMLDGGYAPAEADMQRFFGVTPPSVHNMIVGLERRSLITRIAGQPRSIAVSVGDDELPRLRQPI